MRRFSVRLAVGLAVGAFAPAALAAQGFGVYEQGACTMGRAGATVADPCHDGSAIFFNPAAIANTPGVVSVGGTLIGPQGSFTNRFTGQVSPLEKKIYPVPNVYLAKRFTDRIAAGVGLFAPYGLTTDWNADSSQGRFLGYHSKVAAIYVQPTVAAKVTEYLSVGVGLDVNFASVGLKQRLDLADQVAAPGVTFANLGIQPGTDFADANISANATTFGYHVGVQFMPVEEFAIGARYLSRQKATFDNGTVTFTQVATGDTLAAGNPLGAPAGTPVDVLVAPEFADGGLLTTQGGSTILRFPEQLVIGLAVRPTPKLQLLADWQYTNWSVFQQLPLDFEKLPSRVNVEDYRKTYGWRLGGEYQVGDASAVRLGWYTHGAAAPPQTVTPLLPEGARTSFSAGFGTRLGQHLHVDAAYQYIRQADRQGRTVATESVLANNGLYTFHAHLFGATFAYDF